MAIRDVVALQADIEIVGEALEKFELLMVVKETRADTVILSAGEPDIAGLCSHLLGEYPNLTILVLGADGKHSRRAALSMPLGAYGPSIESALGALRTDPAAMRLVERARAASAGSARRKAVT
jgi:DNA-binding NarL/FixJ family response regulator